jgi:hypothetical protein
MIVIGTTEIQHINKIFFSDGMPLRIQTRHIVSLVYIGQRPIKPLRGKYNFTMEEIMANGNVVRWLKSVGLPTNILVSAESLPKQPLPGRLEPRPLVQPQLAPVPGISISLPLNRHDLTQPAVYFYYSKYIHHNFSRLRVKNSCSIIKGTCVKSMLHRKSCLWCGITSSKCF